MNGQEREALEKLDTWRLGTPYDRMLLQIGCRAGYRASNIKGPYEQLEALAAKRGRSMDQVIKDATRIEHELTEQSEQWKKCPTCGGDGGDLDDSTKDCDECPND